ncbi:MAG: arsenic resistance protein [Coriobacteriia bacterium]|nr:arsenic resistance protein [Coriobacteriia bacterium]
MVRVLSKLPKHLVVLIPVSMLLGLMAGLAVDFSAAKVLVLPMTMLMVYPMLVNFRPSQALNLKDSKAVGLAMALDFVALPLLAWGLALVFFRDQPGLYVGMVLTGLFPTSGMTISWTGFAKGNVGAAVKMTVIGLIVASLLAPAYLAVLAGKVVPVDMLGVLQTVLMVVGVPMLAGAATRRILVRKYGETIYKSRISPAFPGLSTVGVIAIVFIAIGLKAKMIVSDPQLLLTIAVPLLLFYATNFAVSTVLGKLFLPRGDAIAVVYGTVMRNLSIALGIAVAQFGPEAALVLALAYVVQVQSAAWYVKGTDRMFGPAIRLDEEAIVVPARA